MVGLWSLSQRTLLSSKQHIFSIPCPPFLFTYFFTHLSWGCPILTLDNLYLMMWYTGSSHLYTNYIHVVFLICSFILLKKNSAFPPSNPSQPQKFTRNRTGKFTDLKVTWERPASVKPGKAIHDASWAKSSEASKGESLIPHRIHE